MFERRRVEGGWLFQVIDFPCQLISELSFLRHLALDLDGAGVHCWQVRFTLAVLSQVGQRFFF